VKYKQSEQPKVGLV